MADAAEVARVAAQIRGDGERRTARTGDDLFWFHEARKAYAEVVRLEAALHAARGLWYGACAARTEHAHALGLARLRIAQLEARVMRAEGQA